MEESLRYRFKFFWSFEFGDLVVDVLDVIGFGCLNFILDNESVVF